MIDGPSVSNVTTAYLQITGAQPRHLPPRYSFGYLASSMGYAEAHDAQAQIEGFVAKCREHNIPCDGMHLSSGYTLNKQGERCVFTWNKDRFPDPEKMAKTLHDAGIRIFANIKPWLLQESHPDFKNVESKKGLIWGEDGPGQVMQWRGGRHTMAPASYVDFTSEAGYQYWKSHVKSQLLEKGYGLWLDNNEFVIQDESYTFACEKAPDQYHRLLPNDSFIHGPVVPTTRTSAAVAGTALQTLLMVQASYEAVREHQPLQRPFLITRSATPYCSQLVSQTWSGDNTTAWKTIKYNIPMGISAGLCGMPAAYGHDIGGFDGDKPDPEMLVRWVQQGVFWPRFSIHSYNTDDTVTEPWMVK
jgi:alpha-glucosidase